MIKKSLVVLLVLLAPILSGCVAGYHSENLLFGGFSDRQISSTEFQVTAVANLIAGMDRVERIALLRSAELTLQNGGTHFSILGTDDRDRHTTVFRGASKPNGIYVPKDSFDAAQLQRVLTIRIVPSDTPDAVDAANVT